MQTTKRKTTERKMASKPYKAYPELCDRDTLINLMLQERLFNDRKVASRLGCTRTQVRLARNRFGIDETMLFKMKLMKKPRT